MSDTSEVLARWLESERQGQRKAKQQLSRLHPEPRSGWSLLGGGPVATSGARHPRAGCGAPAGAAAAPPSSPQLRPTGR